MTDEILLTYPLKKILDLALKDKDNDYLDDHDLARIIPILDDTESVAHIEWYSKTKQYFEVPFECNPTVKRPAVLWRIQAWRKSENLYKIRKDRAEITLKEDFERRDKIKILTVAIMEKTALPCEVAEKLAVNIVLSKNSVAANNFGIKWL